MACIVKDLSRTNTVLATRLSALLALDNIAEADIEKPAAAAAYRCIAECPKKCDGDVADG